MGDLNADRGSKTLLRIRGFDDVYTDLFQTVYYENFLGDKWTYSYQGRPQQLEQILLSKSLYEKFESGTMQYGHKKEVSDHFPIIVTLDL